MKLSFLFLIIPLIQVTASSKAQTITLNRQNVSITAIFEEIMVQSDYDFSYSEQQISKVGRIDISVTKASINEVLDICFKGQPITYSIKGKNVIIETKKPSLLKRLVDKFSTIDIQGVIVDETGSPLVGATIKVKGTTIRVSTDSHGKFSIQNVAEDAVLVISFIGYKTKELAVVANIGTVKLELGSGDLQEIEINAGYYTVKDRERTGSISRVTAQQIEKQPVNNPLMALQGRVPGLQIIQTTGIPGSGFSVQIRGQNSIKSGNDPFYVVDGVPYPSSRISGEATSSTLGATGVSPLSMINPGDIESIEILKDADATAIYGSLGANGVILITTKKGKEGETKIIANLNYGNSQVGHRLDLLTTDQYIQMRQEAYKNNDLQPGTTDFDLNGTWDQDRYTDWQEELIGGNAWTTNSYLEISSGTKKSNYLIAGNYYKEGTVYPGDLGFKRVGLRSNINFGSANDRFNANFAANFNHTQSNLLSTDLTANILLPPNAPALYDQYGQLNWADNTVYTNPMALLLQTNDAKSDNLIANVTLSYELLKNLTIKTSLGYTKIKRDENQKYPLASYSPAYNYTLAQRISYFGNHYNNILIAEPQINYSLNVGKGRLNLLAGTSLLDNNSQLNIISAKQYTSDDLMGSIGSAALITNNSDTSSQYRYLAIFSRLNYELNDKYFFNLTARRDGSSRFGPGKQFANFGAIGAAWIFSAEPLIKRNLPFINFGKLRASYGITGNDQISDYGYLQLWNTNTNYQGNSTITPGRTAPNADFAWETNRKLETTLQLGFLNNRLNTEISFYQNRSSNLLLSRNLPPSVGLNALNANLPATVQNTGWEFDTSFQVLNSDIFRWSFGFNISRPKNVLLSYPGLETSNDALNYEIGKPLSILKVYKVTVDQEKGLYSIEDRNGSGTIDNPDRYITKFIGQSYYGGFQNSIGYKQFNLDFHFIFTKQTGQSYRSLGSYAPGRWIQGAPNNQLSEVLNRWQNPGDNTLTQKFSTISANNSLNSTVKTLGDLSIVDASFIRLRNISLTYSLPDDLLSILTIKKATISLQGQNLFTLTKYIGLDPETQSWRMPPLRTVMAGINLTF